MQGLILNTRGRVSSQNVKLHPQDSGKKKKHSRYFCHILNIYLKIDLMKLMPGFVVSWKLCSFALKVFRNFESVSWCWQKCNFVHSCSSINLYKPGALGLLPYSWPLPSVPRGATDNLFRIGKHKEGVEWCLNYITLKYSWLGNWNNIPILSMWILLWLLLDIGILHCAYNCLLKSI